MSELPIVSVVIPTYARAKYIHRAIDSVLNQTYKKTEIIVVDDNGRGTDAQKDTYYCLSDYIRNKQILYVVHEINKNGAAARNTGIYQSKGDYICFLDDDDEYCIDKLEKQVAVLNELSEEWAGVYCNSIDKKYNGKNCFVQNNISENLQEDLLLCKAQFGSTSLMVRRDVCMELQGFDETFKRHQDWEFLVRLLDKYKLKLVEPQKALIYYYIHRSNNNIPKGLDLLKCRKKYLDKFKNEIERSKRKNEIYYIHYMGVTKSLLKESLLKSGWSLFIKTCSYKFPSIKDFLSVLKSLMQGLILYCK